MITQMFNFETFFIFDTTDGNNAKNFNSVPKPFKRH